MRATAASTGCCRGWRMPGARSGAPRTWPPPRFPAPGWREPRARSPGVAEQDRRPRAVAGCGTRPYFPAPSRTHRTWRSMAIEPAVEQMIARAKEHFARGAYLAALEDLQAAAERHPKFADVQNLMGLCLSLAGRPEEALAAFERA